MFSVVRVVGKGSCSLFCEKMSSLVNASMVMFVFMALTVRYVFRIDLCVEDCDGDFAGNGLV